MAQSVYNSRCKEQYTNGQPKGRKEIEMKNFNELPENIQAEVKDYLRAFDKIDVFFENGDYNYGACIKAHYAEDHEYIGTYKASEIYSPEEMIVNYVNNFHSYPIQYKGKRDYSILRNYKAQYKMVNGNIEIA